MANSHVNLSQGFHGFLKVSLRAPRLSRMTTPMTYVGMGQFYIVEYVESALRCRFLSAETGTTGEFPLLNFPPLHLHRRHAPLFVFRLETSSAKYETGN